ncbi:hypothetical protein EMCG_07716 [[Emmonsia] crescens]|uniref:Uncharacterized protein n=1 Tax=[Emmonsia] crescens TaxID=73230 RepID=A0A0G2I7J9_9EURO|nr:hypothetical protein EMCG_07716 [Emmonsia crescens UAMH 3008]
MAFLYVAIKKPLRPLGTYHWLLYLQDETTNSHSTFKVCGDRGSFQYREELESARRPDDSTWHVENIPANRRCRVLL